MHEKSNWMIASYLVSKEGYVENLQKNDTKQKNISYKWTHLDANFAETRDWLINDKNIKPLWVDAMLATETRPRIIEIDPDTILINLRGINSFNKEEPEDMVSIRLYITKHEVISCRLRTLKAVTKLRNELDFGYAPKDVYSFVARLFKYICDEIESTINSLNIEVDDLEEDILQESDLDIRQRIIDLRRQMIILKRYLAPNNDVIGRVLLLKSFVNSNIEDDTDLSESHNKMVRFIEDIVSAKERVQVVHEEMNNHLTDRLNKNTMKLSVVATVFLPLSFLTGLFGVNLGGIPGNSSEYAFLLFCLITLIIFIIQLVAFKWIYKV